MKEKTLLKSSEKVACFLDKNSLHKKDFAEMIGVTLSYVYNLIDNTIPFSTRSTTLERISTVMDIEPEEFEEYKIPQEPVFVEDSVKVLKNLIKENNMSVVDFLKNFPRKKRLQMVDMLRGYYPLPIDYTELSEIGKVLNTTSDVLYPIWETRMKQVLEQNGMNINLNSALITTMFDCAKKYILKE